MNIDLLCGHETMLHCGCRVCARNEALEEAAKIVEAQGTCGATFVNAEDCECFSAFASAIRALKDKP